LQGYSPPPTHNYPTTHCSPTPAHAHTLCHTDACLTLQEGATPLFAAAEKGRTAVAQLLLDKGAKADAARKVGPFVASAH
jgi:hypothetical protein